MTLDQLILPKSESWKMFDQISGRYDFLNRVLSLGQDLRWRKRLNEFLPAGKNLKMLDLATGTADVIISLMEDNPQITSGIGIDMAGEMLKIGQRKIEEKYLSSKITLQQADAQNLPFLNDTFDLLTIAFGIRNIPDLRLCLLEMFRVTKSGGCVLILEFSKPKNLFLRAGHFFYLRYVVPAIGFLLTGHYRAYKYLNQTIETFPYGDVFCKILKQFGFKSIQALPLMGGVATIYVGEK